MPTDAVCLKKVQFGLGADFVCGAAFADEQMVATSHSAQTCRSWHASMLRCSFRLADIHRNAAISKRATATRDDAAIG